MRFQSSTPRAHVAIALAILAVSAAVLTPARSEDRQYDWSDDDAGAQSATSIVRECFELYGFYQDFEHGYACIWKPSRICIDQYDGGRQNQYDINTCVGFAAVAWERLLDDVYDRLMKSGAAPKQMETSQSMWRAWNDIDCHAFADYIGTRAAMDFAACRIRHAAERAIELIQLIPR
jgi:uncharacterized protein YecT (DUF1311 family)